MKKLFTSFGVSLIAATLMIGSWCFFNPVASIAQEEGECGGHGGHHHGGHWGHHHWWKKLNLTDAQKKEMFSIRLEERAKMKPMFQNLKAGREQLRTLSMNAQFDEAKAKAVAKEQADILAQMIVEKARMKSRLYAVLTPEQRTKLQQMRESWKAHHEKEDEE